jgi:multidrug efflux pump
LEKQIKGISGVKKVTSNSVQDFSSINVDFNTNVDVKDAKLKVKDAVDKARSELPSDLPKEPTVQEIDVSQTPIMNIHLSGDIDLDRLKKYADQFKDRIEAMKEITRVDVVGALDREIQINVDMYKMEANNLSTHDIESAVAYENMTISGGQINMGDVKRNITVNGQYKDPKKIGEIVLRGATGAMVKLKDIAEVSDTHKEKESYARLEGKNVISLNVVKRSGENLIKSSEEIKLIRDELKDKVFPKELKVTITGDQSTKTEVTLHDLINTIVIGFILVVLILMFFMGTTNAIFVGLSVPLSMCVAFLVEPTFFTMVLGRGFSLNFIVLFAFLLALGIVVDDAIVVIENTHRIFDNGKVPIKKAAKLAAGEVFMPVFSGTLTTLAPFFPLAFWQGIIGKFMFFMPVTMIITLFASLIVAYIINPVFAVDFMKPHHKHENHKAIDKGFALTSAVFVGLILFAYLYNFGLGNFMVTMYLLYLVNKFVLTDAIQGFQNRLWPAVQRSYSRMMVRFLKGKRSLLVMVVMVFLLVGSFMFFAARSPNVVFFPKADPNFVFTYIKLPVGTSAVRTNEITKELENRVNKVLGQNNPLVESVISNVAVGATDPSSFDFSVNSNASKITVAFVDFGKRNSKSTRPYLDAIRDAVKGIPGAEITVDQESGGPPTGKPISIEIVGDDFLTLSKASTGLKKYLDSLQIGGVEELKSDLILNKPEVVVEVNRERASREGISTAQVGGNLRTSVYGKEISKYKDANDEYPIQVRLKDEQRNNINTLMNQKITYRDMVMQGAMRQVPLSAIADVKYGNTYGGIKRKNQKRIVTLSSNVLSGFNANNVVAEATRGVNDFKTRFGSTYPDVTIGFGGEQEEQKETGAFLVGAFGTSLALIFVILMLQFNSLSKTLIIMSEIILSIIGVLLGFAITKMDMSIVMTGIGVVALIGIVVRNGILLVEFTEILLANGMELREAIIEAGKTRMTPVILTASATILGLIPLAYGLNIDFITLFTEGNPHIFWGGDNVAFWGPLSWTMIFGLSFATILTLVVVPAMLLIVEKLKLKLYKDYDPNKAARIQLKYDKE